MFDFPNSPVNGTQATGSGGQVYTFDGAKWVATAGAGGVSSWNTRTGAVTMSSGDVTTALTFTPYNATNPSGYQTAAQVTTALAPYAPLAAPVFTGDARAVTPAYGDNDTSVATTAFVQSAVAPAANNAGRNLVTNGTFVVAQRGAGPWTTNGAFMADRWTNGIGTDTASFSIVALADADRAAIGDETAVYALQNVFTGNAAAGAFNLLMQRFESVRRLGAKTVTISFWAKAAAGAPKLGIAIDQNFGTGGSGSAAVNGNGVAVTISTTWARYSATISVPSTGGKTLGTNGDDTTQLDFWFSSGTNNATRAGNIGVQSGTIQLYGVQLEIGTQATPLDAGGTPQQILAECQRFYQTAYTMFSGYSSSSSGTQGYTTYALPVAMRAAPTIGLSGWTYANASTVAMALASANNVTLQIQATAVANWWAQGTFTASADL